MAWLYYALASILTLLLLAPFVRKGRTDTQHAPFPKGPKPLPYLGNLHQIPLAKSFLAFEEWSRSPETSTPKGLVSLRLGSKARAVALNKWTHVRDLLDSRGKGVIYSDRPYVAMADYVLPKVDVHLVFTGYGPQWRRKRKTIVEYLSDREVDKLISLQDAESSQMMWEFLNFCGGGEGEALTGYHQYVLRYFGAIILASVYGLRGKDSDAQSRVTRFFNIQDEWGSIVNQGQAPPVEVFPWLRYIPDFLTPWNGWKKRADFVKKSQGALYRELFSETEARVKAGKSGDCFLARLIQDQERAVISGKNNQVYSKLEMEYIGGFLIEAGADTTAAALETFIIAMATQPDIQKRAQEEIDQVFGLEYMPHTADGSNLPFLRACFLETLRWRPPFPAGIPHANTADDKYDGYSIPKGTSIILNIWAVCHDPDEFDEPDSFNPSRYLANRFGVKSKAEQDNVPEALDTAATGSSEVSSSGRRETYAFGAGRRVCAGQRMAENSSMMTMAKLVWCFDVVPGGDEKPDVDVRTAWRDSILAGPKPFPVKFVLRGENKRRIIKQEWEKADQFLKKYE